MTTTRKSLSTSIAVSLIALLSSGSAFATLDTQFSSCAAKAIESQNFTAKKIVVDLPSNQAQAMDHDVSSKYREFKMAIKNTASGEELGKITCRVNQSGHVQSATYLSKA